MLLIVVTIVVVALWAPDEAASGQAGGIVAAAEKAPPAQSNAKHPSQAAGRYQVRGARSMAAPTGSHASTPKLFADRAAAPALGSTAGRNLPVAYQGSAPLDMGTTPDKRRRGRSAYSPDQVASSTRSAISAVESKAAAQPSRLTREPVRNNTGARRQLRTGQTRSVLAQAGRATQAAFGSQKPAPAQTKRPLVETSTQRLGSAKVQTSKQRYTVRSGDSLERIARRELGNASRWRDVAKLNGISDPNLVRVGQVLTLPQAGKAAAKPAAQKVAKGKQGSSAKKRASASSGGAGEYIVAKGDVLSRIAERQLGSSKRWREIVALNPGLNPSKLHVGARLVMPSRAGKAPTKAPAYQGAKVAHGSPPRRSSKSRYTVQ